MPFVHGKNTFVSLDAVDLSTFTKSTSFEDSTSVHDVTTYGPTRARKSKAAGLGDGKATISGVYDSSATGPRATIKPLKAAGESVEFVFQPEGVGAGKPQSVVNVIIASYNESSSVDDMIQWTCELEMDGDLDETDQV
jgi:hypothetical protein